MIRWYFNRLRTFSVAEIPWRIRQIIQKWYERYFCIRKHPGRQSVVTESSIPVFTVDPGYLYPGTIKIFGKDFQYAGKEIDWHKDIFSDESFPLKFSKSINIYRRPGLSAKAVWEINRLQFLPHLALNYKNSGSSIYLAQFTEIMNSWIDQNPYLLGINWYSNIEVNIRLINWFLCWKILDVENLIVQSSDFKVFVETRWLPSIYLHCCYSFKNPSCYSSSNNHLIAEYSGLFIASSLWKFEESETWLSYSHKGLEDEIGRQHSSGINREEAAEYIQFITDFFLLSFIVGNISNNPFSETFGQRLHEIFIYILEFLNYNGDFPNYGDEDDGKCYVIDTDHSFNNFKSLLTSGALLFMDPALKSGSNGFDLKNRFLFCESSWSDFDSIPVIVSDRGSKFYRNEGHFIFRKTDINGEIYMHFDAAPLGFLSLAAHGHADALSFILHVDGHPVLIDSGTYTYHTDPVWRRYFVGTLAHNTVRINQKDQAVNGGPTMWTRHYNTNVTDVESDSSSESITASHDGYKDENAGHTREVTFFRERNEFQIIDTIDINNNGTAVVEIPFHLHPAISVTMNSSSSFTLSNGSARHTELLIDPKLSSEVLTGQTEPQIIGWYSGSFMNKQATSVIYCKALVERNTTFKFLIKIV